MIVPTRRFWALVALGFPIALLLLAVPSFEPFLLVYNIALLLLLTITKAMTPNPDQLKVTRVHDDVFSVTASNTVEVELENQGQIRMVGRFRDEGPQEFDSSPNEWPLDLAPGSRQKLIYALRPKNRGQFDFSGSFVRFRAPLGLCEVQHALPTVLPIRVYPNIRAVEEFDLLNQRGRASLSGVRKAKFRGQGSEFESLRDYQDDDFRRVDWKSTAKRGKLIVREYELERNQAVFIAIDAGRHMLSETNGRMKFDDVLDSALLMMHAAERAGDQVGLLVFGERVLRYVAPRRGKAQVRMLLDAIHDLQARPVETNYTEAMQLFASRWTRRALVVMFTDVEGPEDAQSLLRALNPLRHRHLWFLARISDPRLRELAHAPLESEEDVFRLAAYDWYAGQRESSRRILNQRGLRNIEAEPQDLARELVKAYWDVKQSGQF